MFPACRVAGVVLGCWLLVLSCGARAEEPAAASSSQTSPADAQAIALEGYLFGYPLVLMDISRQVMTAIDKPTPTEAPLGQFNNSTQFPDPSFTAVVSPNADTLYSFAWLADLSREPYVLSLPDTGKRYYLMQMMDAWTNVFANPGTRTTGDQAGTFAIVGPTFKGTLPPNVKELRSPTDLVWIIGRTQTNGPADYAAVRELKSKYKLQPLSTWGTDYTPPKEVPVDTQVDRKTPPVVQAAKLSAEEFFARLAKLMEANPPTAADRPVLERLAKIGVAPGAKFDASKLSPAARQALEKGVADARQLMLNDAHSPNRVPVVHGWAIGLDYGGYGTNYRLRAVTALAGLGANLAADAVYPMASSDGDGKPLTGEHKYTLHFAAGKIPPVNAFWSLTMYNADRFFVKNPLNRYALGDRDPLQFNKDGSLTLLLQHNSPGKDRESNWLPAPEGKFNLIMRLYWPKPEVLDGTWTPPSVKRGG